MNRKVLLNDANIVYMGLIRQQSSEDRYIDSGGVPDKQGYLMYQTSKGQNWKPVNVTLRGGVLFLYGEDNSPLETISLLNCCTACDRSIFPDRPHTFSLSLNYALDLDSTSGLYHTVSMKTAARVIVRVLRMAERRLSSFHSYIWGTNVEPGSPEVEIGLVYPERWTHMVT